MCLWWMVSLRMHQHEKMIVSQRVFYYVLAIVALVAISWAGHLGGSVVYHE